MKSLVGLVSPSVCRAPREVVLRRASYSSSEKWVITNMCPACFSQVRWILTQTKYLWIGFHFASDSTLYPQYNPKYTTFKFVWLFWDTRYIDCISRICYIGDLRSGQFRDLPIIGEVGGAPTSLGFRALERVWHVFCQSNWCGGYFEQFWTKSGVVFILFSYNQFMRKHLIRRYIFWGNTDRGVTPPRQFVLNISLSIESSFIILLLSCFSHQDASK